MRIAVLSDIHANLEALVAVDEELGSQGVERVVCLGDNIGYGPDPDSVVTLIRDRGFLSVLGNHEFALKDIRGRRWMNFLAAENSEATAYLLSGENREYCKNLPSSLELEGALFVHGFPKDNVFRYLNRQPDEVIATLFKRVDTTRFFVGHTHRLQMIVQRDGEIERQLLECGKVPLDGSTKYIFNCGSVGQPRDKTNHAKYLIWDSISEAVEVRFVTYDYSLTMEKIRARGFPENYGLRLR